MVTLFQYPWVDVSSVWCMESLEYHCLMSLPPVWYLSSQGTSTSFLGPFPWPGPRPGKRPWENEVEVTSAGITLDRIHITPWNGENAALFNSTVRPAVHINPLRKRSFSKTPFKPEEFKNAGFAFQCGRKTFWAFRKHWRHDYHVMSCPSFPQTHIQKDCWVFKFLRCFVDGYIWCVFRVKPSYSNSSALVCTESCRHGQKAEIIYN